MKENNTSNNCLLNDSNTSQKNYIFNENENEDKLNKKFKSLTKNLIIKKYERK